MHSEKFREPKYSRGLRLVDFLRPMAARYDATVGQLAVAWVLRHPGITSAIVGARSAVQVEANQRGSAIMIGEADMRAIDTFLTTLEEPEKT